METLGLTGSDLPEIGDKSAVSKVLNGDRRISHKMAYALAERFHMNPKAFIQEGPVRSDSAPSTRPAVKSVRNRNTPVVKRLLKSSTTAG